MNLARAFFTVGGLTMASRVLGLAREIMIASLLGAGPVAEAFFVAFRFPNLFRRFFAEGAFNMAFIPLFAKRVERPAGQEGETNAAAAAVEGAKVGDADPLASARRFAEDAQAGLIAVLLPFVTIVTVGMPWAILAIAFGFSDQPDKLALAEALAAIQFPYLFFISLVALYSGVLNSLGRFAAAAGAPILLNIAMIAGMAIAWYAADPDAGEAAAQEAVGFWLAWAVFVSGVLQLALLVRATARAGLTLRLRRPRWTPDMRRLVRLGLPGAVAGGVTQINILIGTTVATFFDGAVAWLTYADRLYQLPLGVIGVAIGVALLPELSRRLRADDAPGASRAASNAVALALAFSAPAAVALIVVPEEIIRVLFARGAFTEQDVADTALATLIFAIGLPAYVLNKCLSPAYFAQEDTRTPLRYAMWSMGANTVISAGGAFLIGWVAVPIGTALAAWINIWLLWRGLGERPARPNLDALKPRLAGIAFASLAMGTALYAAAALAHPYLIDPVHRYPGVLALCVLGAVLYLGLARLLGGLTAKDVRALRRPGGGAAAA